MDEPQTKQLPQAEARPVNGTETEDLRRLPERRTWLQRLNDARGGTAFIVLTVSIAIFTDLFVYAVIVPVVPFAFTERMGVAPVDVQKWISVSLGLYSAGLIIAAPICGYVADKMASRRATFLCGLAALIGSTLLLCLAKHIAMFVVGRFVQGASGAIVWTVGLALISDVADGSNIAQLMGYPSIAMSLGMIISPLIGGVVYEREGYYAVFGVCFGILILDVLLRIIMKEPTKRFSGRNSDEDHNQRASDNVAPDLDVENTLEMVKTAATIPADPENTPAPAPKAGMTMLKLFRTPRVLAALLVSIVMGWLFSAFDAILTVHLAEVFSFNSLQAGLMFLCIGIPQFVGPLVGYIADKYGSRWVVSGGFVALAPFLILLRLPDHNTTQQIVLFAALLCLVGIACSVIAVPLMGELTNAVIAEESKHPGGFGRGRGLGQVYGLFNVAFAVGSIVGPFQAGFTMNNHGWGLATISLGIISFVMAFPTAYYFDGSLSPKIKRLLRRTSGH